MQAKYWLNSSRQACSTEHWQRFETAWGYLLREPWHFVPSSTQLICQY
jgi:hypothetical protein